MRYFAEISYSGTNYHGWQEQKNARGLQQVISEAISMLLKENIKLVGSGRTDSGVHAFQQFAHFDSFVNLDIRNLEMRLNRFLPDDIAIHDIFPVSDQAHARFSAKSRIYEYWITNEKNPFLTGRAWYFRSPLDIDLLNEASAILMEFDDFQSFSRVKTDVKHFRCQLISVSWKRFEHLVKFTIHSDRYLRGMVRAIVGTMVEISQGKITLNDFRKIIKSKNRRLAGPAAPACGLYLAKVEYPTDIFVKL